MNADFIAEHCKLAVENKLNNFTVLEVQKLTPSVRSGVRYVGVKHDDGRQFFVQIEIEEI